MFLWIKTKIISFIINSIDLDMDKDEGTEVKVEKQEKEEKK
jgi:hypothetical protein